MPAPTTLVAPDANGVVSFRKSVYDDDADTINLVSLQVTKKDGVELAGDDLTPAWLSYTTSSEVLAEGPLGSRSYLHIDIDIDTDDAGIVAGSSYEITFVVNDGVNANQTFSFQFANGEWEFDSIGGLKAWLSARKDETSSYNTNLTSIPNHGGDLVEFTRTSPSYYWQKEKAVLDSEDAYKTDDYYGYQRSNPFDTATPLPFHLFIAIYPTSGEYTGKFFVARLSTATATIELSKSSSKRLQLYYASTLKQGGTSVYSATGIFEHNVPHLVEIVRGSDNILRIFFDGVERITVDFPDVFPNTNVVLGDRSTSAIPELYYLESVWYEAELTADQIAQCRKKFKQIYPSMPYSVA